LFFGPDLVLALRDLAGGEARHQAVGVRSHQIGDLGLLPEPREVLRALKPPEAGPSLSRCIAVEGSDEVDEKLRHGSAFHTVSGALTSREPPTHRPRRGAARRALSPRWRRTGRPSAGRRESAGGRGRRDLCCPGRRSRRRQVPPPRSRRRWTCCGCSCASERRGRRPTQRSYLQWTCCGCSYARRGHVEARGQCRSARTSPSWLVQVLAGLPIREVTVRLQGRCGWTSSLGDETSCRE